MEHHVDSNGTLHVQTQQGAFAVGTRLLYADPASQVPLLHYGPGYVHKLQLPNGLWAVDDTQYAVGAIVPPERAPQVGNVRGGLHGGLGCFAVDWHRQGAGMVQLDGRRIANGPPYNTHWHRWQAHRIPYGVYAVDGVSVAASTRRMARVALQLRCRHRDGVGHALDVHYTHTWYERSYHMVARVLLNPSGNEPCWVKEPRIAGCAYVGGSGLYTVDAHGQRRHYPLGMQDPTRSTLTIGPDANSPANRYPRRGVVWPWPRGSWLPEGSYEATNWHGWRQAVLRRGHPPVLVNVGPHGEPLGDFNPKADAGKERITIASTGPKVVTGAHQRRVACFDHWEITKRHWLPTAAVFWHTWGASIGMYDYSGMLRRVRPGEHYQLHLVLR